MMLIERHGVRIKLTSEELARAYFEAQHQFDMEDLWDKVRDGSTNQEVRDFLSAGDNLSQVAYRYRKYLDNQDDGDCRWSCFQDAMNYVRGGDRIAG